MTHKYQNIILFNLLLFVFIGCKDTSVNVDEKKSGFNAKIVDLKNNPLDSVGIHYIFYLTYDVISRNIWIKYQLQSSDTVTVKIYDAFGKLIATPINKQFQLYGSHSYDFDASKVTNGVYSCTLLTTNFSDKTKYFVRTDDVDQLKLTTPFSLSDINGRIQIPYFVFGIGNSFTYQVGASLQQVSIADSIKVIYTKDGYKDYYQTIKFDTTQIFETTIQLQNN